MTVGGMWRSNAVILVLLVVVSFMFAQLPEALYIGLGALVLAGAIFICYRQGGAMGHEACSISKTIERIQDPQNPAHGQLDKNTMKQAYDVGRGFKGLVASALIPYVINCAYLIVMILAVRNIYVVFGTRLLAYVVSLPFWPLIAHWHEAFDVITPDIIALLMLSPFVLPAATFIGYLQGPKLWEKTEKAMAQGKRRAKAKSRVAKKRQPRVQKPEI